jgi:hypothetical protein
MSVCSKSYIMVKTVNLRKLSTDGFAMWTQRCSRIRAWVFKEKHFVPLRPIDGAGVPKKSMVLPLPATGGTSTYIYKLRANLLNCAV